MNYSKGDVILLSYPFTDLSTRKVRPAVVISPSGDKYSDVFLVPLTSKINNLKLGESVLSQWREAGLNVTTAFKRGCILVDTELIIKKVGELTEPDRKQVDTSLKKWLHLE